MHQDAKVARRYAKSLLDFALEQNKLEEVRQDMALVSSTMNKSKDLVAMLKSPVIKTHKKVKIIHQVFAGKIGTITSNFLDIIANKRRENVIADIAHSFVGLYREHQGILLAEITTAVPLDLESRNKAMKFIEKLSDKVELKEKIDPSILGGFIIRVGGQQYDESVASRISGLKRAFSKNPYIAEI